MIYLNLNIQNPWHNENQWPWHDFYQILFKITKNKTLELNLDFYPISLIHFNLDTRWQGRDHAGPQLGIGILGFGFNLQLCDNRHWDVETNNWINQNDNQKK